MAPDVVPEGHGLPNTRWSEVETAGKPHTEEGRVALDSILARYRPALLGHLRAKFSLSREDAEDTLHSFIEQKILARNWMAKAQPRRGRFRTFLLSSLDRFTISEIRQQQARKRAPDTSLLPLHDLPNEQLPADPTPPASQAFDRLWAEAVLRGAYKSMEQSCKHKGQDNVWRVFSERLLQPLLDQQEQPSYEDLSKRYDLSSPSDAFNLLASGKRIFRRHLHRIIGEYAQSSAEIEEEIAHLRKLITHPLNDDPPATDPPLSPL
jgi:DNA-directed RNA polymerase specialized sigma24 family protein